jgi:ribonuclease HI
MDTSQTCKEYLKLYSDGACSGNPGPGAYGSIMVKRSQERTFTKSFAHTTNNRMELLGVIEPIESLEGSYDIEIWTDSQYVANAINEKWLESWIKKGWKKADKKPVLNRDLWQRLLKIMEKHTLTFNWIRGHNAHPQNERCDQMAVRSILLDKHKTSDTEYELSKKNDR